MLGSATSSTQQTAVLVVYQHFGSGQCTALLDDLVVNNASTMVVVESTYQFSPDILFFRVFWRLSQSLSHFLSLVQTYALKKEVSASNPNLILITKK